MLYRDFGKTGRKLSILGFGAMRLPVIDKNVARIDESKAIKIIRSSIDKGVNYLDTAYPYHEGNSELVCAKAMREGYRHKVNIATKLPTWDIKAYDDMDRILSRQLEKLEVETIDFYLLHALCKSFWKIMKENDYAQFLDRAKKEGRIEFAGFSFHDNLELFKEIVDDYEWDFCQIQLNYLDVDYQAGLEGMQYAAEKGLGIVIMEPLRAGMLALAEPPQELQKIWDRSDQKRSQAEWALRYLWNFPQVGVVLSGMNTLEQVNENVAVASTAKAKSLTDEEQEIIHSAKQFYEKKIAVNCTQCQYCMPCPNGVDIPENFWAYNHDSLFDDFEKAHFWVTKWLKPEKRASNCIDCGECEENCPQAIQIREHLKRIAEKYETCDQQ